MLEQAGDRLVIHIWELIEAWHAELDDLILALVVLGVRVRQVELERHRVGSDWERHLEQQTSQVDFELGLHEAVDGGLAKVHIDPVELLAGWHMPGDETEALFDKVCVALQFSAVRSIRSRHCVLKQLVLALLFDLAHFLLLLFKDIVVLTLTAVAQGVQIDARVVTLLITAALVHELLGKFLRVFPLFVLILKV